MEYNIDLGQLCGAIIVIVTLIGIWRGNRNKK